MIATPQRDLVLHCEDGHVRGSNSLLTEDNGECSGFVLAFPYSKVQQTVPSLQNGLQYCDACNASCHLMNGQRRKLQARYEGFLLVKRVQGDTSASRYLAPTGAHPSLGCSRSNAALSSVPDDRRHSFGEVLDDTEPPAGASPPHRIVQPCSSGNNDFLLEKLVNLYPEGGGGPDRPTVAEASSSHRSKSKKPSGSAGAGHQRLSRKKSRSQDNLVGRLFRPSKENASVGGGLKESVQLNNRLLPTTQLHSSLSRSEGSIHNVTRMSTFPNSPEGGSPPGGGGIKGEGEDFAKIPKRLLDRVSDEVGQIVFYLERWREEYVILTHTAIALKSSNGRLETLLPYSLIEDARPVATSSITGHQHCLLVVARKSSFLMQASTSYVRDQWLHTIIWKKNAYKYRNLLNTAKRPEVLLKELKNLVELSLSTPLHDHSVCQIPLELTSSILFRNEGSLNREANEEIIVILAPLLENNRPSLEICSFFSRHCSNNPRSSLVIDMFTPVVSRILKHNVNFGKYPHLRRFVHDYIQALNSQNDGRSVVHKFVQNMHGSGSCCPHLRVLPNLVAVCTSAICFLMEAKRRAETINSSQGDVEVSEHLDCYFSILQLICEYDDWRLGLAHLLQPIPFPDYALADEKFIRKMLSIVRKIGTDPRCEVHQMVLGPRDNKEGWLHLLCPSSAACCDKGETWAEMLQVLLSCCYKRKKFLRMLLKSLGSCMLLALRDNDTAQEVLCLMLEWKLVEGNDQCLQIITTLQSTCSGKKKYLALCDRQMHLRELQQKFGPRKLTLPHTSTDSDLTKLLSTGPFGNLEVLSLAFTRVTSACAEQLIKLPTLRHLSLWATQFGDNGLLQICEHLHQLQILNLCETPVTDKGLSAIAALKNLRKLNLNSTKLSLETFELLKEALPALQEIDVRYTDAW